MGGIFVCVSLLFVLPSAAVTTLGFVDRGRNVVSGARDGTVRLWDCGTSKELLTLHSGRQPVNCITVAQAANPAALHHPAGDLPSCWGLGFGGGRDNGRKHSRYPCLHPHQQWQKTKRPLTGALFC